MQTLDPVAAPPRESREELLARARALISERRIPAAFAILQELVDFDLHDAEAWSLVAHAWHQWGHGDRCQRAAELALRVNPQAPFGHVWRCRGLLMQEQKKPALEAARDGMSATERHPDVQRGLLEALLANAHLPEAELNLRDLRTQFPDDPDLVVRQGELHFHKKEFAAAETAFLSVLTTASDPADVWSWLGATRLRQERRKDAVPCYYRAALSSAAGFAYTKLLVEIVDALLRRKLDYTFAAYIVGALIAAALAYAVHPLLAVLSIPVMIWFWKKLRVVLVSDSLRPWPKELGDYYLEQKPIVDRHGVASLGLAWFIMLVLAGLGCGAAQISQSGLWPDVGRLLLVLLPPVLWFWLPHVNREKVLPGERVTFWFPDEETEAVQFSGETSQWADPADNARTLLRGQRLNAARRTASRTLGMDAGNLRAHQVYSLALLAAGDAEGGLAAARRAQSLAPDEPAVRALMWLHQAAAGPAETVVADMRRDSRGAEDERRAFAALVRDLGAAGAADAAGAACAALSQWAPESAEALGLQGDQLFAAGRRDEAETAYRQAHAAAPDSPIYLTSLGWMAWQRRRLWEARDRWCEALRQDPTYAPAADSLGTMMTWAVALVSVGVTLTAALITTLPTLVGRPQNDRMFWMTLAAPFLAATSAKPLHRLAVMGILPSLSPAMSQLAQGNPAGTRWIAGILGLVGALVIHSFQAWIEIALHPALWDDRWKGAATVTVITTYLAVALIWWRVKTRRADQVAPDRILAERADPQ